MPHLKLVQPKKTIPVLIQSLNDLILYKLASPLKLSYLHRHKQKEYYLTPAKFLKPVGKPDLYIMFHFYLYISIHLHRDDVIPKLRYIQIYLERLH
jgi:hypothetical protein